MPDPQAVRSMFARIAPAYDLLNRTLSLGIDQRWRRAAIACAGEVRGRTVVDSCCGTGDLSLALAARGARVVGVDFTREMVDRARAKAARRAARPVFVRGDALRLPLASGSADAATVAFGIRNVADRRRGLDEMRRVVRPGGRVVVLEFGTPRRGVFGALYRLYFTRVLPWLGRRVSGDADAYSYLPRSVLAWPDPETLRREMEELGFTECAFRPLTRGIAFLHWGNAPVGKAR